jgi:hypothetical protein
MNISEHKIGDLVLRYYFTNPIIGQVINIEQGKIFAYKVEWLNPEHYSCVTSCYDIQEMREGKRRLDEYQRTQDR